MYKRALGNTLKNFPDVTSAKISLNIGKEWFHVKFDDNDLKEIEDTENRVCKSSTC